jgi:hypothetical protein
MTLAELEREIQQALRADLGRARRLVAAYVRRAARSPERRARAMAAYQRAKLAHALGRHREASAAYDDARRGFTAPEDLFVASIGAVQVRALLGDAAAVRTEARRARRLARDRPRKAAAEMAIARALTSLGDERAAERCLRAALGLLGRRAPSQQALARESLGLRLAARGAMPEAIRELDAALSYYGTHGLAAAARAARHNRGWALGLKGDALHALADLRAARKELRAAGERRRAAVATADEAELCLRLGARARAAALAREAAAALRDDAPLEAARTDLLAARATGDRRLAARARALLARAGDEAGAAAAAVVAGRGLPAAERTLHRKGHLLAALDALLARARSLDPRSGARLLARRARAYPAVLRRWALPDLYAMQARGKGRLRMLRRAFRAAEDLRRRAPTGSLRAATLSAHLPIYEALARALLDRGGDAARREAFLVLDAARARTLREELGREAPGAGDEPRVAAARARLEALWRSLERRERDGGDLRGAGPRLLDQVSRSERKLVAALDEAEPFTAARAPRAALPDDPCLAWAIVEGQVVGLRAAAGEVAAWPCGPLAPLRELAERFRFQVARRLHGAEDTEASAVLLERLGRTLLPPEPPASGRLAVILPAELGAVPVEALPHRGRALVETCVVSYAACASLAGRPRGVRGPALALGFDVDRLPEVRKELAHVRARFPAAEVLEGSTRETILRAIRGKRLVHIAGHAEVREDLPIISALKVADGWVTAGDLAGGRLARTLFVLSACRTGDPSLLWRGEALGGFPRSLLAAGCNGIVASRWDVPDRIANAWMACFYETLSNGPPDVAVATASRLMRERHPHPADWAAFLLIRGSALRSTSRPARSRHAEER